MLDDRPGILIFRVRGWDCNKVFANERGLICWQRVPPTEKRGRTQTSSISIAILKEDLANVQKISKEDLIFEISKGSGKGGQKRNKTSTKVRAKHKSGFVATIDSRSQHMNKEEAIKNIQNKLNDQHNEQKKIRRNSSRVKQIGVHSRGSYFRTVREKEGIVINHYNNTQIKYKNYVKGIIEK